MPIYINFKSVALQFFLVFLGILFIAFFILGGWLEGLIKDLYIEREKTSLALDVQTHAGKLLEPQLFVSGDDKASQERFEIFFDSIRTPDIVRIKVWNAESRIIFSDEQTIIGKSFPDDEALQSALSGNIEAHIEEPTAPENIGETAYKETSLLEVYIPVYFGNSARPAGVIEKYLNLDEMNALISKIRASLIIIMFVLIIGIFSAAWLLFRFMIQGRLAYLVQKTEDRALELERDNKIMVGRELKMMELKKELAELKKGAKNGNES